METPNTRARRKRELAEMNASHEETVTWGQNDHLLEELMEAGTSDMPLPLPSPTQRPRRVGEAQGQGGATHLMHVRKRLCRTRSGTSSTTAPASEESGRRLDELLDRFLDISSSRPGSTSSTPRTTGSSTPKSTSRSSTSSTGSAGWHRPAGDRQPMGERSVDTNRRTPVTASRSMPLKSTTPGSIPQRRSVFVAETLLSKSEPMRRLPVVDVTPGVRSSPRRAAAVHAAAAIAANPSPLRAPPVPAPAYARNGSNSARANSANTRATSTAQQPHARSTTTTNAQRFVPRTTRGAAAVTPSRASTTTRSTRSTVGQPVRLPPPPLEPQPSSDGDTSIDSLDMMFENGGEEIEMLLLAMDGLQ